jgi:hypothetical protein
MEAVLPLEENCPEPGEVIEMQLFEIADIKAGVKVEGVVPMPLPPSRVPGKQQPIEKEMTRGLEQLKAKLRRKCEPCGKTFCDRWSVERHVRKGPCVRPHLQYALAAGLSPPKPRCPLCQKRFSDKDTMKRHLLRGNCKQAKSMDHLEPVTFDAVDTSVTCHSCEKLLSTSAALKRHLKQSRCKGIDYNETTGIDLVQVEQEKVVSISTEWDASYIPSQPDGKQNASHSSEDTLHNTLSQGTITLTQLKNMFN